VNEEQAVQTALKERHRLGLEDGYQFRSAEERIIEIVMDGQPVADRLPGAGLVKDLAVWVVVLAFEASEAEIAIDTHTGQVARFRRSRG